MQLHGSIHSIKQTQKVSDKFQKREFILVTEESTPYPQYVTFELQQDKCDIIDAYHSGQQISVDFNIRGRLWNGPEGEKAFNTLVCWKIQPVNKQ